MQTLGEKLEEARTNKGLSIQEAAEQTKIRVSFLESFEQNKFDFDLPEIYKRGFLKNYAELLGLDPGDATAEFGREMGTSSLGRRKEKRENFGKIDLSSTSSAEPVIEDDVHTLAEKAENRGFRKLKEPRRTRKEQSSGEQGDKLLLAAVGVSIAAVIIVVGFLVWMFGPDKNDPDQVAMNPEPKVASPTVNPGEAGPQGSPAPTTPAPAPQEEMSLEARGGDVHVILLSRSTQQKVFDQTIKEGEVVTITKSGAMTIIFDDGEKIYVRLKGKLYKMPNPGAGRNLIP